MLVLELQLFGCYNGSQASFAQAKCSMIKNLKQEKKFTYKATLARGVP